MCFDGRAVGQPSSSFSRGARRRSELARFVQGALRLAFGSGLCSPRAWCSSLCKRIVSACDRARGAGCIKGQRGRRLSGVSVAPCLSAWRLRPLRKSMLLCRRAVAGKGGGPRWRQVGSIGQGPISSVPSGRRGASESRFMSFRWWVAQ